jgi:glutamate/tyrosine decarboxylase-like PLP-dependent enzyme
MMASEAMSSTECDPGRNITLRSEQFSEIEELDRLFQEVCPMIREYELQNAHPDEVKVVEYLSPSDLRDAIKLSASDDEGSMEAFLDSCRDLLKYSVRTRHPRFMNQLYAGSNPSGQIAELLTAVLNSTVHTYAAGPVFAVVERCMITRVAALLGHEDPPTCDGVFAPGGSHANLSALMAARSAAFPHVASDGWRAEDRPTLFVSAHAHYSIRQVRCATLSPCVTSAQISYEGEQFERRRTNSSLP